MKSSSDPGFAGARTSDRPSEGTQRQTDPRDSFHREAPRVHAGGDLVGAERIQPKESAVKWPVRGSRSPPHQSRTWLCGTRP